MIEYGFPERAFPAMSPYMSMLWNKAAERDALVELPHEDRALVAPFIMVRPIGTPSPRKNEATGEYKLSRRRRTRSTSTRARRPARWRGWHPGCSAATSRRCLSMCERCNASTRENWFFAMFSSRSATARSGSCRRSRKTARQRTTARPPRCVREASPRSCVGASCAIGVAEPFFPMWSNSSPPRAARCSASSVDLVVDLGHVSADEIDALAAALPSKLRAYCAMPWRTVTLAGGGFPKSIADLPYKTTPLPRWDFILWRRVATTLGQAGSRVPLFGDYGMLHP